MKSINIKTTIFLLLLGLVLSQTPVCPSNSPSNILQATISLSVGSVNPIQNGVDIQCFNYTLPTTLSTSPQVAIAVNNLQSQYSPSLFFSIKALFSNSTTQIPFVVRTQWPYTRWSLISFSFLAQTSARFEAGSYQLDTAYLSSCISGKQTSLFLPFINQNSGYSSAVVFLNGFQLSGVSVNSSYITPYQVQVVVSSVVTQGATISISSTSATQIYNLVVSYIAFSADVQNYITDSYVYNQYVATSSLQARPSSTLGSYGISGFSGFIIANNRQSFSLTSSLVNGNFALSSTSSIYYLAFSYFYLVGGACSTCQGFPINFNGQCVASCPPSSFSNGVTCITCQTGQTWNGSACVSRCTNGQVWDSNSLNCVCASGSNWNGVSCVSCTNGQVWNSFSNSCGCSLSSNWNGYVCITCGGGQIWSSSSLSCVCPSNTQWNGVTCSSFSCPPGQTWNPSTSSCNCPFGVFWTGSSCVTCSNGLIWNSLLNSCGCAPGSVLFQGACVIVPTCSSGQVLNTATNICVCGQGTNWNGTSCVTCGNGQIWNNQAFTCSCPSNTNWNGYSCVTCQSGQTWNAFTRSCSCPGNLNWNGFNCISCTNGQTWNSQLNACSCPNGLNWNGVQCQQCNPPSNWNGFSCVTCSNGQVWSPTSLSCQCPSGLQWNGVSCITPCNPPLINVNGLCSCPSGTYQSQGTCIPTPTCQSGQVWQNNQCVPIQCPPGQFWSGSSCTSTPPVVCPAGTFWNGQNCATNTTNCPPGTYWTGSICQTVSGQCPAGTYQSGTQCIPISQQCPGGLVWSGNQCIPVNNTCPPNTYFSNGNCLPNQQCSNGQVWNATFAQCACLVGTFWSGSNCIQCSGGQTYQPGTGCFCPSGTFFNGTQCTSIPINQCASILNSIWNGNSCVCNPGYTATNQQCVCTGLAVSPTFCDRCFSKPNSTWINGICQCNAGFFDNGLTCVPNTTPGPNPNVNVTCAVATYFDSQQLSCLPCSSGCLSCTSCYSCTQCQPGFYLDFSTSLCVQVCGDGKRFTLGCDDNNNVNGDGCSSDCKVQVGFTCSGGSPSSRDSCTRAIPQALTFVSTGQSHLYGKIVLNIQVNYLPLALIQSATDCRNACNNVLSVRLTSGDVGSTGITASYIPSSSFSFSVQIQFKRQPIGMFTAVIGINPNLVQRYFSGINVSNTLTVNVNPAFLSIVNKKNNDILN